jgi:hypothetical protein
MGQALTESLLIVLRCASEPDAQLTQQDEAGRVRAELSRWLRDIRSSAHRR